MLTRGNEVQVPKTSKPATLQMSLKSSITAETTVFQKAVFLDVIMNA
jgi:hypothetical protein